MNVDCEFVGRPIVVLSHNCAVCVVTLRYTIYTADILAISKYESFHSIGYLELFAKNTLTTFINMKLINDSVQNA